MTYPVKWFTSAMRGAPVISGTAGSRITALDACLRTGFGSTTPSSVVVSGGVATATVTGGETFHRYSVILIEGATGAWADLNGEARVTSDPTLSASTVTWLTDLPDGTATGAITLKYAPLGWNKPFEDVPGNIAVFQPSSPLANGHYLRLADGAAQYAEVRGYEEMTGASVGVNPFPTEAQIPSPRWWGSTVTGAAAREWLIVGDHAFFFFQCNALVTNVAGPIRGFGDMLAIPTDGDTYSGAISVDVGTIFSSAYTGAMVGIIANNWTEVGRIAIARAAGGAPGAVLYPCPTPYVGPPVSAMARMSGRDSTLGNYLAWGDRLELCRLGLMDPAPRADVPGALHCAQMCPSDFYPHAAIVSHEGRLYVAPRVYSFNLPGVWGFCLIDITGPWR